MKRLFLVLCIALILIVSVGCAQPQQQSQNAPKAPPPVINSNQPAQTQANSQQTRQESASKGISGEVAGLLNRKKVSSVYYKYKGPQTADDFYEFYVKGSKIRYKAVPQTKVLDRPDSYESIFIDTASKTAQSYCADRVCVYKGKKQDLNYDDAYISTAFDWINIKDGVKVGEEVIDDKSVWKIQADKGIIWVDTYYGLPLKVESSGKSYRFVQYAVNSVEDADVNP